MPDTAHRLLDLLADGIVLATPDRTAFRRAPERPPVQASDALTVPTPPRP